MASAFDYDAFEAKLLEHLRTTASTGLSRVEMGYNYESQTFPYAWVMCGDDEEIENDINGQRDFELPVYIGICAQTKSAVNSIIRKIGKLWYENANALKAELYQYGVWEVTIGPRARPNPPAPETGRTLNLHYGGCEVRFSISDSYVS